MTLTVLPGRVAVLYPTTEPDDIIVIPESARRRGEYVMGNTLEGKRVTVLDSGFPGLYPGDEVVVRADAACLSLEPSDYPFVPEGHEVRVYGVSEPVLDGSPRGAAERGEDIVMWREA